MLQASNSCLAWPKTAKLYKTIEPSQFMNMRSFFWHHRIALLILLLALALRLSFLPYAKFENETARDLTIATQIIDNRELYLKGLSSEIDPDSPQQTFGPLFYYLLVASQLVWRHPYSAFALITLMIIASAFLFYLTVRKYFGFDVALIAMTLYVFNPWVFVFISLNIANPSFLLPFLILHFYSLCKVLIDKQDVYLLLMGISLASMLQLHLSSLLLLPITLFFLLVMRPSIFRTRFFYLTLLISALFFLPYLIYGLQRDSFADTFDFAFSERYSTGRLENFRDSLGIPFMLATTYFGPYLLGTLQVFPSPLLSSFFLIFDILTSLILGIAFFWLLFFYVKKPLSSTQNYLWYLLLVWFIFPIILAIIPGKNVSPHYFYITYPSQFVILALFFTRFPLRRTLRTSFFALLVVLYLTSTLAFFFSLASQGGTDGIYGVPLKSKLLVLEFVHQNSHDGYLLFYDYVKPEYSYLQPYAAPSLHLLSLTFYEEGMSGYLLLDFYSRGNFGEQHMTLEERRFYESLPSVTIGRIKLVSLKDYENALSR